jgi:hypothetical protein
LRVVSGGEAPPNFGPTLAASIWSAPFRPGELPIISWVPLGIGARERLALRASDDGLPEELWVRIAVESSRLVSEIASLSGEPREHVASIIDGVAADDGVPRPAEAAAGALRRYATELANPRGGASGASELALHLPEEMAGTWSRTAARERLGLAEWVAKRLDEAPTGCVEWEMAAAGGCQSLGEWAYASWLRASASSKA